MRNANGTGSVYKMKDKKRRKPWIACAPGTPVLNESTNKINYKQQIIGSYPTREDAINALSNYRQNPYDLDADTLTFKDVFDKWGEVHYETVCKTGKTSQTAAFQYFKDIFNMKFTDVRPVHIEACIRNTQCGYATKSRMKSICSQMYKYAIKNDIATTNYAALCDTIKKEPPKVIRIPFTWDEEELIWEHRKESNFYDVILLGLYSGFRPLELVSIRLSDIDLDEGFIQGGVKTDAGRNRKVPIHSMVYDIIKENYEKASKYPSEYLFFAPKSRTGMTMTVNKYGKFIYDKLPLIGVNHKPHDTRHTFITRGKEAGMNEYVLKRIVGHAIDDLTEKVYTHRELSELKAEIEKIQFRKC